MDSASILIAGAVAGAAHVALAPDHVMALLVFSADARRQAWRVGLWWGIGHAGAIALVALVLLELRQQLRLDFLSDYGEYVAGVILVAIGLWGLHDARRRHSAGHGHAGEDAHLHTRLAIVAGFAGGLVHSFAGNGLLLATLPALGLSASAAHAYLLAFFLATVASVVALAAALGAVTSLRSAAASSRSFLVGVSWSCVLFGVVWLLLVYAGLELHPYPAG